MRCLLVLALALGLASAEAADAPATAPIHLDVAVRDARGRAADKLSAADFTVTDGGQAVPVISARFVGPAVPGTSRVVAFYLDEYHVDAQSAIKARELLTAFVRDDLGPDDQMIVLKPLNSLLTLQLTTDRQTVLDEIASFEGRLDDYEPRSALEREVVAGDRPRIDEVRAQIAVSALHALTAHLAQLPAGRKALVVVSDGFVPRAVRRGGSVLPTPDAIIRAANRSNVAIYPVVANVPASDPPAANETVLRRLATETDGRLTDLSAGGLRRVTADMTGYYLLEFASAADGRFHAIEVKAGRPGFSVRTRPGFWTVSADELTRARRALEPLPPPPPALPAVRASRLIRPWIGQARGSQGLTQLTVVWEAVPLSAGVRSTALPPARLRIAALTTNGTIIFQGVVAASSRGTAVNPARAVFDVPPGRVRLQMAIEDLAEHQLDTDVRDVIVLPLDGPIAFGTPAVYRARTARAFGELLGGGDAQPATGREFSRDERLLIRVPVYGDNDTAVSAQLTSRGGQAMRTLLVERLTGSDDRAVDIPLAGLAAGEYSVVIRAHEDAHESSEAVQFRVTP